MTRPMHLALALLVAGGLAGPALARTAGEPTRAPKATTAATGKTVVTAPAARAKARRGGARGARLA